MGMTPNEFGVYRPQTCLKQVFFGIAAEFIRRRSSPPQIHLGPNITKPV